MTRTPTPSARLRGPLVVAALFASALSLRAQIRYSATDLGPVGSSITSDPMTIFGVNASGQVAAYNITPASTLVGIRYSGFTTTTFPPLAGDLSAKGIVIDETGTILGESGFPLSPGEAYFDATRTRLVRFASGGPQALAVPSPRIFGANLAGQMVGDSGNRAFVSTNGVTQLLPLPGTIFSRAHAINAAGQIVGWSSVTTASEDRRAFLFSGGLARDLGTLGGTRSQAQAINAAGQIVGFGTTATGQTHAFLFSDSRMSDLGLPVGALDSQAFGINRSGQIAGWSNVGGDSRGWTYFAGEFIDLTDALPPRTATAGGFSSITMVGGINDAGQITGVGQYFAPGASSASQHAVLLTPLPEIRPATTIAVPGSTVRLEAVSTLVSPNSYQWFRNGVALPGATESALLLTRVAAADAAAFTCTVGNDNARATSAPAQVQVTGTAEQSRLVNLSVRALAGAGSQTLIVGFSVGGAGTAGPKPLLVRAIGPALAGFGVTNALPDPTLALVPQAGGAALATNDDWAGATALASLAAGVGAFALPDVASKDAVLAANPGAGAFSAIVSGKAGATGVALAEIYDTSPVAAVTATTPRLINLSARSQIGLGNQGLFAGFVITGTAARTILVRAIGPTLAAFGVTGVLADPRLDLFRGSTVIASNDNWGGDAQLTAIGDSVGAFRLADRASRDAVLAITLPPGTYSAQVTGVGGTTGVALVEIYEAP
ncbi:MAG: hypothetical protein RLZZ15_3287 [Verrucomicrobiota bacterium]|jgi:probable HAF family extracellular repeat protein